MQQRHFYRSAIRQDFRPAVTPVLSGSGTVSSPYYVNCASLDFKDRGFSSGGVANNATVIDIPKPESDFRCDYDYYVSRIDKPINITKA